MAQRRRDSYPSVQSGRIGMRNRFHEVRNPSDATLYAFRHDLPSHSLDTERKLPPTGELGGTSSFDAWQEEAFFKNDTIGQAPS